jgi:arylsulfatase A-like enzyme
MADRPNVLFLFTDDQRHDTLHGLGNEQIVTPHMDELARRGCCFTRAHIMGSYTAAVCIASRSMLLTGRTLWRAPQQVPESSALWPELMRQAGYRTFSTGKWHNDRGAFHRGFDAGAKIFFGGMSNHMAVPVHDFDPSGEYPAEKRYIGKKFSSELFTDQAVRFLEEYEDEEPFFMYVSYTAPHDPRMAPDRYEGMYPRGEVAVPENFLPQHPFDNGELRIRDEKLAPWPRTPEIVQEHIGAYYAMITHLDDQVGRVLEALQRTGHAEDTTLIFAGDNGLAVGQHGLLGKQNLYEHSIRVPLSIAGPGLQAGAQCDADCYLMDIFPTICEMTGLEIPDTVEGRSLLPLMRGESDRLRETTYFAYMGCQRGVRDERFKLLEYKVDGARTTQLFDLQEDPWELNDLSADPEYADDVGRLRAELRAWQRQTDDPEEGNWDF